MSQTNKIYPVDTSNEQREYKKNLNLNMNMLEYSSQNLLLQTPIHNHEEMNLNRVSKYMIPADEEDPPINNE